RRRAEDLPTTEAERERHSGFERGSEAAEPLYADDRSAEQLDVQIAGLDPDLGRHLEVDLDGIGAVRAPVEGKTTARPERDGGPGGGSGGQPDDLRAAAAVHWYEVHVGQHRGGSGGGRGRRAPARQGYAPTGRGGPGRQQGDRAPCVAGAPGAAVRRRCRRLRLPLQLVPRLPEERPDLGGVGLRAQLPPGTDPQHVPPRL